MIKIGYTAAFIRMFKKLQPVLQDEAIEKITLFKDKRYHHSLKVHKLKGTMKDKYSFSVNYRYRIVFEWLSKNEAALLAIGDHEVHN